MVDLDGQDTLLGRVEAGGVKEPREVTFRRTGALRFVRGIRIELTGDLPEGAERSALATVVPDTCRHDSAFTCNPGHLAEPRDRIVHEVDDELREHRIERLIRKRELLGRRPLNRDLGLPLAEHLDEGLGRIDRGDGGWADTAYQLCRERTRAGADVEHMLTADDARKVRERDRERGRVPAHEPVVGAPGDGEAHDRESTLRVAPMHHPGNRAHVVRLRALLVTLGLGLLVALQPGGAARGGFAELNLEQQVGQLIVLSFAGTTVPPYVRDALDERRAAGVILFGKNIVDPVQLRALTLSLRRAGWRPIVAVDQEGGPIRRVPWVGPTRSAPEQVAAGSVRADAEAAARGLRSLGITTSLAPVADVPSVRDAAISERAFARDPRVVSEAVRESVRGWRAGGVAAAAKHFPGIGAAPATTDDAVVTIRRSRAALEKVDLLPFAAAIAAGVPLVMVGHARYPALDRARVASQSRPIIEDVLRQELGFRGVVVTDSLEARASLATGSITTVSERAIRAGADLVLLTGRGSYAPVYRHLLAVARRDSAFRARVEESAARVLALKARGPLPPR